MNLTNGSSAAFRLMNQFYCVSTAPAVLPDAVIALNSPGLGNYEAAFVESFHRYRQERFPKVSSSSLSQRPLLVCADGAIRRLEKLLATSSTAAQQQSAEWPTMVDFVVGDFDSLPMEMKEKHEKDQRWLTVPTVRDAPLDVLLPDLELDPLSTPTVKNSSNHAPDRGERQRSPLVWLQSPRPRHH